MDSIARHLVLSALYFVLIGVPSASFAAENICHKQGLEIRQAEIRATPPNAPVTGGYLHIYNHGTVMQRLTASSADFSSHTEIHQMVIEAGVMKMSPLKEGIEIAAGGISSSSRAACILCLCSSNSRLHLQICIR